MAKRKRREQGPVLDPEPQFENTEIGTALRFIALTADTHDLIEAAYALMGYVLGGLSEADVEKWTDEANALLAPLTPSSNGACLAMVFFMLVSLRHRPERHETAREAVIQ